MDNVNIEDLNFQKFSNIGHFTSQIQIDWIYPQTTFNEYGLCYTFNNVEQGIEDRFKKAEQEDQKDEEENTVKQQVKNEDLKNEDESTVKQRSPMTIRKVTGCGRNHGFQLVVDSQQVLISPLILC